MSSQRVISAVDLRHSYGDGTAALRGLNLEVNDGERVGLIGANGAGKSTFLLHLNGLLHGQGALEVLGLPVVRKHHTKLRRNVGMVFQNPDNQLFCATVYEDVAFGLRNQGRPEREIAEGVGEALASVGMLHAQEKSAFHLSVGEKKRVALATVLVMAPAVLVLDEPSAGLDPKGRRELLELLAELGGTQLIASHDFDLVRRLCSRVIVMHRGADVAQGPPDAILSDEALLQRYDLW